MLHYFSKHVGGNLDCRSVADADVLDFLAGNGQLTRYRANKYGALTGFYRYASSRGYAARSPLPAPEDEPRKPRSAPPYVYSGDELRRLFGAIDSSRQRPVQFDADTLRTLLLVLYGAGLRFGEAQRLTLSTPIAPLAVAVAAAFLALPPCHACGGNSASRRRSNTSRRNSVSCLQHAAVQLLVLRQNPPTPHL